MIKIQVATCIDKKTKLHASEVININTKMQFGITINPYHMYNAKPINKVVEDFFNSPYVTYEHPSLSNICHSI